MRADEYRRSLAMADYYHQRELERQATERRIMGGGYGPGVADDLTQNERRLTLGALWFYKKQLERQLKESAEDDWDETHMIETFERFDSAARKLGGDPAKNLYGAAEYGAPNDDE